MTWDLARGETFLPRVSVQELKNFMATETNAKARLRWLVAIHRKEGKSMDEIAESCAMTKSTVQGILHRFKERGKDAALAVKQDGRPPELTIKQRELLLNILDKGNPRVPSRLWTSKEVLGLIKKKFGVVYTPQHIWKLLRNCGFSLLQPRPRHYKSPTKEEQNQFKKKHEELQDTTKKEALLWVRKMKPHLVSSQI